MILLLNNKVRRKCHKFGINVGTEGCRTVRFKDSPK